MYQINAESAVLSGQVVVKFYHDGATTILAQQNFGAISAGNSSTYGISFTTPSGTSGDLLFYVKAMVSNVEYGITDYEMTICKTFLVDQGGTQPVILSAAEIAADPDISFLAETRPLQAAISRTESNEFEYAPSTSKLISEYHDGYVSSTEVSGGGDPPPETMTVVLRGRIHFEHLLSGESFNLMNVEVKWGGYIYGGWRNMTNYAAYEAGYTDENGEFFDVFTGVPVGLNITGGDYIDLMPVITFEDDLGNRLNGVGTVTSGICRYYDDTQLEQKFEIEIIGANGLKLAHVWYGLQEAIMLAEEVGYEPSEAHVDIHYDDDGTSYYTPFTDIEFYWNSSSTGIGEQFEDYRRTIAHEYGHKVQWTMLGSDFPLSPVFFPHYTWREFPRSGEGTTNDKDNWQRNGAYFEGFAHFYSCVAQDYFGHAGSFNEFETIPANTPADGEKVEGKVAAALWDLYDKQVEEAKDYLVIPFQDIMDAVQYTPGSQGDWVAYNPVSGDLDLLSLIRGILTITFDTQQSHPAKATLRHMTYVRPEGEGGREYLSEAFYIDKIGIGNGLGSLATVFNLSDVQFNAPNTVTSGQQLDVRFINGDHWGLQDIVYDFRWRRLDPVVGAWQDIVTGSSTESYSIEEMPKNEIEIGAIIRSAYYGNYRAVSKTVNGYYNTATAPTNLRILSATGSPLKIAWDAVLDGRLAGYKIYRSVDYGVFSCMATVGRATLAYTDSDYITGSGPTGNDVVRYYVKAYHSDPYAISAASNTILVFGDDGSGGGLEEMSWGRGLSIGALPETTELEGSYPNPFNSSTLLKVAIANPGKGSVVVYNSLGRQVHNIDMGYVGVGRYEIPLNFEHLSTGTYFVELKIAGIRSIKRITYFK